MLMCCQCVLVSWMQDNLVEVAALWKAAAAWEPPVWLQRQQSDSASVSSDIASIQQVCVLPARSSETRDDISCCSNAVSRCIEVSETACSQVGDKSKAEACSSDASSADGVSSGSSVSSEESSDDSSDAFSDEAVPDSIVNTAQQDTVQPAPELHGHLDALFASAGRGGGRNNSQAMRLKAMQLLQRQPPAMQMPASQRHREQASNAAGPPLQLPSPHGRRSTAADAGCALLQQPPGAPASGRPDSRQSGGSTVSQQKHNNPVTVRGRAHLGPGELACGLRDSQHTVP